MLCFPQSFSTLMFEARSSVNVRSGLRPGWPLSSGGLPESALPELVSQTYMAVPGLSIGVEDPNSSSLAYAANM